MLTKSGWAAIAGSAALVIASALLGYVELAALGIAGVLAVAVGFAFVLYRPQLDVDHVVAPLRVTVGDAAIGRVTITNTSTKTSLPVAAADRVGPTKVELPVPRLAPGATIALEYSLPTARRTVMNVGPLEIFRADPFGFVRFEQRHGQPATLYVHPRRFPLRPLPATLERSIDGPTAETAPRGTQIFQTLREYVPGDDRRMIHWKTSARTGTLMVRQHVDTSLPDLTILLDTRQSQHTEASFEAAVEAAASLAVACTRQGFPVRLKTTDGQTFEPQGGEDPTTFFLDRLAGAELLTTGDLMALAQALGGGRGGYALVAVTGDPSAEDLRSLSALHHRFETVTLVDMNPATVRLSVGTGVNRIEATTGAEFAERWNLGIMA